MQKKGFTLVELLAVIVILGIILVIAVPNIVNLINQARIDSYERQKDLIIDAAQKYVLQNGKNIVWTNDTTIIYLNDLQNINLLDNPLKDPRGGNFDNRVPEGTKVTVTRSGNNYTYTIFVAGTDVAPPTYADNSGANAPVLLSNMIPIKWNGSTWIKADVNNNIGDNSWYDYDNKIWANAVAVTNTSRANYQNAALGTAILEADILAYFVWIPRYRYLIPTGTGPREIDIIFENNTVTKSSGNAVVSYLTHPAFTFGTTELSGIWVGKFETTGTISAITIKPNITSLRSQTISAMFNATRAIQNTGNVYGFPTTGMDIHVAKNIEWGAVAYLSHSKYGKNNEVWINPVTNYITGCAGNSASAASTTTCNAYNTSNGINASTTGNVYGIYDMSGGAWEYVMGNLNNTIATSGFSSLPDSKYYDRYTSTTGLKGDATDETAGWYGDTVYFPTTTYPWFSRSSYHSSGVNAGTFYYSNGGGNAMVELSFRIVISNI